MRIFLTGATGFVGSHLLRLLVNHRVPTAALLRPGSSASRLVDLRGQFTEIAGDLSAVEDFAVPLRDFQPDTVIHVAWEGVSNRRRNDPLQLERNVPRTIRLIEVSAAAGVKNWVGLGSQAEYGPCDKSLDEDQPPQPTTLYGVAKLATCQATQILCRDLGLRFSWLRLFSPYGPMDDPGWLIPLIILKLIDGESPSLTEGSQRWDYLYVTDVAEAIYRVASSATATGVFNLGSGEPRTVRSIAELIRDRIDPSLSLRFGEIPYRIDQVMHLEADTTRLQDATGWQPRMSLESGLAQTIEWFLEHRDQINP